MDYAISLIGIVLFFIRIYPPPNFILNLSPYKLSLSSYKLNLSLYKLSLSLEFLPHRSHCLKRQTKTLRL
jgi:hypothetical protein